MANADKNIIIRPRTGESINNPVIEFVGADGSTAGQTITATVTPENQGTITFTGTSGTILTISDDVTEKLIVNSNVGVNGNIVLNGTNFSTTLQAADPTASRTITFQDTNGTVALLSDITGGGGSASFDALTITGSSIIFEGATADDFETTLTVTDPTADRTITLPNASGTVAVSVTDTTTTTQGDLNLDFTLSGAGNVSATGDAHGLATTDTPTFAGLNIGSDSIAEYIADTVGAMVTSNTESGISVTYQDADNTLDFDVGDFSITLTGDVTGTGTVTNLGNVSFATTIAADSVALGTDTTGNYVASLTAGALIDLQNNTGEGATPTIDVDLSELTDMTAAAVGTDELVILDAGLQRRKAINEIQIGLFDTANQIALGTDTTGNYVQQGSTSGNGISGSINSEGGTFTVTSNATDANTASTIVFRDASGDFSAGTITATLSGNATTATTWATGRTITLTGDVTGTSAAFDGSGNLSFATTIAANSVALGTDTTGNYVATIAGTTNQVTVIGSGSETAAVTISLPQNIHTGASPTFAGATLDNIQVGVTAINEIDTTSGDLIIDSAGGTVTIDDNLTVTGNLTVSGTTTTINTETITLADNIIVLNSNEAGAPSENAGIEIERGTSTNVVLQWNETSDYWEIASGGTTGRILTTGDEGTGNGLDADTVDGTELSAITHSGDSVALTGDVTGSTTVASDGSISIATTIAADSVALGTDTTGNYVASLVAGALIDLQNNTGEGATPTIDVDLSELTDMTAAAVGTDELVILDAGLQRRKAISEIQIGLFDTANQIALGTDTTGSYVAQGATSGNGISGSVNSEGGTFTVTSNATNANTASTIVFRDASGDFSAGTITATLSGNATTATTWATGRTITLTGDVTGTSTAFDGSGNLSFATTIAANSVALGTDTTGNYVAGVTAGALIDITGTAGEGWSPTIDVDLSELTDMTAAAVGTDELVILDAGLQRRKAINEIQIGLFDTANQIALGTDTTGNYMVNVQGTTNEIEVTHTQGEGSTATIGLPNSVTISGTLTSADASFTGTTAVTVPNGTDAQRPGSPASGMFRFNTTSSEFEGYDGSAWGAIGDGGTGGAPTITDETTNATRYVSFVSSTSGDATTLYVTSTKLYFNPSTGQLNATEFNSLSDATYKENITEIDNSLDILKRITPYSFNWKEDGRASYGVIAQEIEKILPELVSESEDGKKSVSYIPLIALLIDAVKRLAER